MTATPALTVGIPVYNRETLIRRALDSALQQPFDDLEILVVDNASTDRTWEILESYRDPRLRLVRNDRNLGLFGNFNRCIGLARGRYVCTLCSDDVMRDGFLGPARDVLDTHPGVGLVSTRGRAIVEDTGETKPLGATLPAGIYRREDAIAAALWALSTYYLNPFNYPSGILLRTDVARGLGMMDEKFRFGADVKLYLAMLETTDLAILDVVSCDVLFHSGQENALIYTDSRHIQELASHFRTYESLLAQRGMSDYVRTHVAGFLLGSHFQMRRHGHVEVANTCLDLMKAGRYSKLAALWGVFDSLVKRAAFRRNAGVTSPVPVQSLA